jgi:hypothetical protein
VALRFRAADHDKVRVTLRPQLGQCLDEVEETLQRNVGARGCHDPTLDPLDLGKRPEEVRVHPVVDHGGSF